MDTPVDKKIYVGHLNFNVNKTELTKLFESCIDDKETVTVDIPTEPDSERGLGYAIIEFSNSESAVKAIAMDGIEFNNRRLKISEFKPPKCRGRW